VDANVGWIVGEGGVILKTTDGGDHWVPQNSGTTKPLLSVAFLNQDLGFAVGYDGTILKTTDGGTLWSSKTSGTSRHLTSVHFPDQNTGWTVGAWTVIYKTTDGGENWSPQSGPEGVTVDLWGVRFIDANTGWTVGGLLQTGTILKTTDGGDTWTSYTATAFNRLSSVFFIDTDNGFTVGNKGTILKTTDSGVSWTTQTSGTDEWLRSVYFAGSEKGWIVGDYGTVLKTPVTPPTSVEGDPVNGHPVDFRVVLKSYPNPFNASAHIAYHLPASTLVSLNIHDLLGRSIATLVQGRQEAGHHEFMWNAEHVSSGTYLVRLKYGDRTVTNKIILQK